MMQGFYKVKEDASAYLEGTPLRYGDKVLYRAIRGVCVVGTIAGFSGGWPWIKTTGSKTARFGWMRGEEWRANPLWLERRA
jgi:hypothetical protein